MEPSSIPDQLNEEQLSRYLTIMVNKMLEKIQEKNPDLKKLGDEDKKLLVEKVVQNMLKNKSECSKEALKSPQFMIKLTAALVLTATLKKHEDLSKKLDDLFNKHDIKNEKDLETKMKLDPKLALLIKDLQKELQDIHKELLQELKKLKLLQAKPEPSAAQKEEEFENTFDKNTNLIGLINTHQTGGIPAVVQSFTGNLYGVPVQGPTYEESEAQISQANKTSDTQFGDPMGLNNATKEIIEALGDIEVLIDEVEGQYRHEKSLELRR